MVLFSFAFMAYICSTNVEIPTYLARRAGLKGVVDMLLSSKEGFRRYL